MIKKKADRGFRVFTKELKNNELKNVTVLYGQEDYLIRWAIGQVKKKYIEPSTEMIDYVMMQDDVIPPEDIMTACRTLPMLSEKRVVVVRDFAPMQAAGVPAGYTESGIASLIEFVKNPPDCTMLIFASTKTNGNTKLMRALKKYGTSYQFDALNEQELMAFANKRFQARGLGISTRDMHRLIQSTGYFNKDSEYRLDHFVNDLTKIIALCPGGRVTAEAIESSVEGDRDKFIFNLLDGISGNDKSSAFSILHNEISAGTAGMQIAGSIISQMEVMYIVRQFMNRREMTSPGQISRYTGLNEYRVKKAMQYARRYSAEKLRHMLSDIYEVNVQIVTGLLDERTALELFIAKI
ncbi:DNA polymerase III subunit delta [Eubacterium pyruvativorans]|uniref:DNA polymerase III subunit delta n=1 Tax=Eubacterium pyruvativorans TaxID=155865 RepID=UPI000885D9B3|nr:DNA polymerase III subunit delta [Eubacterium pyruvativorans]SDE80621.1 DNA polymerase III, delta subunit [Eubacterium pyruvativorans]